MIIKGRKNKKPRLGLLAVRTRLELATSCVTGRHSNQLNYRTSFLKETQNYKAVSYYTIVKRTLIYLKSWVQ